MAYFEEEMLKETSDLEEIQYSEETLKVFNLFNSTIKFTAEYAKEEVNFLDVNIKLIDKELKTDLFV